MVNRPAASRRTYDTARRALLRHAKTNNLPCALCGGEIDYTANQHDPRAFTADHTIPWSHGGSDSLDNLRQSHRHCNVARGNRTTQPPKPAPPIVETSQDW